MQYKINLSGSLSVLISVTACFHHANVFMNKPTLTPPPSVFVSQAVGMGGRGYTATMPLNRVLVCQLVN